jgi:Fe2+ or Zn2+ uptake regulation protein
MTPQRHAVLSAVKTAGNHPCADDVFRIVQSTSPGIGVATVYRTLDLLVRHGEVLQLRLPDETITRYDANTTAHHHVTCGVCDSVFDIALELPADVVALATARTGVEITQYDLRLRGTCATCRDSRTPTPATQGRHTHG